MAETTDKAPKKSFFKGVKSEWGKITWPEKNQVVVETFFVVAIVFIFTIFIFFADRIFEAIFKILFPGN